MISGERRVSLTVHRHTPSGKKLLRNFAVDICGAKNNWTMSNFIDQEISRIRNLVGPTGQVLGAVVRPPSPLFPSLRFWALCTDSF